MTSPVVHPILKFLADEHACVSPMLILMHDYPDPDAIASAWGLAYMAEWLHRVRTMLVYGGLIGRMENQTMVKLLRIPMKPVKPEQFDRCRSTVLVDTQPPFGNNQFPSRRRATAIIDHHPRHARTKADHLILDHSVGATATLVTEALVAAGCEIPRRLATALAYGIGSETQNLLRETDPRDVAMYRVLLPRVNMRELSKIQHPPRPASFFSTLGRAIERAFVVGNIIGVHLGDIPRPDIVAEMADFQLSYEKMQWSMVTGRYHSHLIVSLRTHQRRANAGRLLWRLLGSGTSAGGHGMIAGGFISVSKQAGEAVWQQAEETFTTQFLKNRGFREPFAFEYPFQHLTQQGT